MTTTLEKPGSYSSLPWSSLEDAIGGDLLLPDSPGYEEARHVWNGMIDRRPAAIARARTTEDVVAAVNFGRENGLEIAVRGGGHNAAGLAVVDDGLVIDLTEMNQVQVDPERRIARAGGHPLRVMPVSRLRVVMAQTGYRRLDGDLVPTVYVEGQNRWLRSMSGFWERI